MPGERVSIVPYVQRIKCASNKEEEIKKILDELGDRFSLTKDQRIDLIAVFEGYFQNEAVKRQKPLTEHYVPCRTGHSGVEPLRATDNSDILDALKNVKQIL